MTDFKYSIDDDRIASIIWDSEGKSINTLTLESSVELNNAIERALKEDNLKGIIIGSNKKDFSAGMDLIVLQSMMKESKGNFSGLAFKTIMEIHRTLRKLELAGRDKKSKKRSVPVVWACPGLSAGIGTEIGLACHYRIVSDDPRVKVGLPETLVGLFPFGGGTTRLMRSLGALGSSQILLEGKMFSASAAKSVGLVDEVVEAKNLINAAKEWIFNASEEDTYKPWDKANFKVPGGAPYQPSGFLTFVGASAMVNGRTQGLYPAHRALMSAAYEGLLVPFEDALRIEARWAVKLLTIPSTYNMIRSLFVNKSALEKGRARPKDIAKQNVKFLGIIGAGMMGSGIAYVSAMAGINVVLIDASKSTAEAGKGKVGAILQEGVKRRKTTPEEMKSVLARINATDDYNELKDADLIIEAVFENGQLKADVTKKVTKYISKTTIIASNTSTIPISDLAKASINEKNFVGIHFFSPVHKMQLLEIIKGEKTGDRAVSKALDFAKQIRKTPIVVNDSRYFYANRCIIPYINEGVRMVGTGVKAALIENGARQLGMPVGPLQLIDETSIDLANQISTATRNALGKKYIPDESDDVLKYMVENGRLGRKVNAGFYNYDENGNRLNLWPDIASAWPNHPNQPDVDTVKNRLALIQALEAIRAFEENVLMDIRDGDVGAILGWGCIPWAGGPFGWLDLMGTEKILELCKQYSNIYGQRFIAPRLVHDLHKRQQKFYDLVAQ
ncbi:MAG: 3-hydroxyacyl-CoA dehydrogenase NAD-binding domain-containing protein [Pseudomonadota bacterium]|nr:3-hydroxyacyl-CoA dehydrogenase NAD-binding domain-containing protein [Pseudomonadota bacterium]